MPAVAVGFQTMSICAIWLPNKRIQQEYLSGNAKSGIIAGGSHETANKI